MNLTRRCGSARGGVDLCGAMGSGSGEGRIRGDLLGVADSSMMVESGFFGFGVAATVGFAGATGLGIGEAGGGVGVLGSG
jgi:hypothetical protein